MSFGERVEQLNQEIGAAFDRAFSTLRRELQDRLRESHEDLGRRIEAFTPPSLPRPFLAHEDLAPAAEGLRAEARGAAFGELRDALATLDQARTQAEVLSALIAAASQLASRAALLLVRGGELRGWGGQGFADSDGAEEPLRDLVLTPPDSDAGSPWSRLLAPGSLGSPGSPGSPGSSIGAVRLSSSECAVLCGRIESPVPAFGFLVPLVLRDRVVAALYADQLAQRAETVGSPPDGQALPALQSLVYVAALAIESLPFRQRPATATLVTAEEEPAAAPVPGEVEPGAAATAAAGPAAAGPAAAGPATPTAPSAAPAPAPATAAPGEEPRGPSEEAALGSARPQVAEPEPGPSAEEGEEAAPAAAGAETAEKVPSGDDTHPRPRHAAAPFEVTPATLYDSPGVPVVKETAEIPLAWPLRPAEPPPSRAPGAASSPRAATAASAPSAQPVQAPAESELQHVGEPAAESARETSAPPASPAERLETSAPLPEAGAAGGGGEHETVLLPFAAKDKAPAFGETWTPRSFESAAGAAAPGIGDPGAGGPGNLRAVPPVAPMPAATANLGTAAAAGPPPPSTLSMPPVVPVSPALEPLRTGPLVSGTPEVRPPSGVQGPGWAFSTTRVQATSSEEALHEEARRLARLLVSEIKLYNEEQVEAGRRNRDIYERLREDIDRSRQMYEERVEPRLVKSTDYFYQELVRILAAGDSKALGI
jgi:hypothetical protein